MSAKQASHTASFISEKEEGISIECKITPRARKTRIKGIRDKTLLIALNAPPVDGKANEALVIFFASLLSIPKSKITILKGEHSRNKIIFLKDVKASKIIEVL